MPSERSDTGTIWIITLSERHRKPGRNGAGRYAPAVARQRLRRDESQAQTREALLAAARDLFDAKGFLATSIADIADEAGYTTGAVYSNFSGKDDLFLAVLERQVTDEMTELQAALSAERTIDARLDVVGRWYATQAGEGRRRTRVLAELALLSGRGGSARIHARMRDQRKRLHEAIAALLRQQEVELGIEFRLPLPTLATCVLALLEGFALSAAIDDEIDTAAVTAALEMLLRPVAPPS